MDFRYLVERSAIIDLSEIRRQGTPEDVRLVANIIGKYVSVASLNRGANFGGELKHLFVVDDALDVVPEVLMKKTTADVGTIEYMATLLRATGQGLIVVSQRPNIAENVTSNSAVKVFFRTVVDSKELAAWVNLNEEQAAYLKVLPKQEAVVMVPQHSAPMRIRIPDVSSIVSRKVTNHDIIVNNMVNYPLMYDMQMQQEKGEEEARGAEAKGGTRKKIGGEAEGKEWQGQRREKDGIVEEDGVSKLSLIGREAWSSLRDYFERGLSVDSDFVSKMLDMSQPAAHRTMLSLKSAGLVSVAKIPNYAHGEGFQYLYYSSSKCLYGDGVVGYVRERLRNDLEAREVVVELSPRDAPNADMVVQHDYPLVIHVASGGKVGKGGGSRLPALNERVGKVAGEFTARRGFRMGGGIDVDTSKVIVVTLWRGVAEELNAARREGKLVGSMCVLPFGKKWVDLLADYALNHITLQTLLGEETKEQEEEGESGKKEGRDAARKGADGRDTKTPRDKRITVSEGENLACGNLREKVLGVVRELGGVEPRAVANRLSVALWRVSKVARELRKEGLIKIARNLPYISSLKKANATYYLDASKQTALHDTVMNLVWETNAELGGSSRDFSFQHGGRTWYTDGLLKNVGGCMILEVVAGGYDERIVGQIEAYSTQVGHMGIIGVVVVGLDPVCLDSVRKEATNRGIKLGEGILTTLRSRDEKLQLRNLLLKGKLMTYHRNLTS